MARPDCVVMALGADPPDGGPFAFQGESARLAAPMGRVTLLSGTSFCVSDEVGDIDPSQAQGWFAEDRRLLSRLHLEVADHVIEPLGWSRDGPAAAWFAARLAGLPTVLVRRRELDDTFHEHVTLLHHGRHALHVTVRCTVESDRRSVFAVKERRPLAAGAVVPDVERRPNGLRFGGRAGHAHGLERLDVECSETVAVDASAGSIEWTWSLEPGTRRSMSITMGDRPGERGPTFALGGASGYRAWRDGRPSLRSDWPDLDRAVARALDDLASLRIPTPTTGKRGVVLAAGAPWFMTLFGRDSLIASWMALPFAPELAIDTLTALADLQGTRSDPVRDEEPGRIIHELRPGSGGLTGGQRQLDCYYGSVDATPLFVALFGELHRWIGRTPRLDALLPATDRALAWITRSLATHDHGFLSYERATPVGLANQGWKDSWDGIRDHTGAATEAPLALCEVQAYVYDAFRARALVAHLHADEDAARAWNRRADTFAARFDDAFWMPGEGTYAVALDRRGAQVGSITSNVGHCLWAGIVGPARIEAVTERLLADDMFTGWGLRTLAKSNPGYDPLSYHCGSVWPHDTAIAAMGLARGGRDAEALRLVDALIATAAAHHHHLPELFGGFGRDEIPFPVSYPSSCSPQAWAAAAPLGCVRALLRLEPSPHERKVSIAPLVAIPGDERRFKTLTLHGVQIADAIGSVGVHGDAAFVSGLPDDWYQTSAR